MTKKEEKKAEWIDNIRDYIRGLSIAILFIVFMQIWYYGGYNMAKTEDTLMCVRDCMPYPYE